MNLFSVWNRRKTNLVLKHEFTVFKFIKNCIKNVFYTILVASLFGGIYRKLMVIFGFHEETPDTPPWAFLIIFTVILGIALYFRILLSDPLYRESGEGVSISFDELADLMDGVSFHKSTILKDVKESEQWFVLYKQAFIPKSFVVSAHTFQTVTGQGIAIYKMEIGTIEGYQIQVGVADNHIPAFYEYLGSITDGKLIIGDPEMGDLKERYFSFFRQKLPKAIYENKEDFEKLLNPNHPFVLEQKALFRKYNNIK